MIRVIRFDGSPLMLNADWIQSVEATPDTLITLTTGFKLLVRDHVDDVVNAFRDYKRTTGRECVATPSAEDVATALERPKDNA